MIDIKEIRVGNIFSTNGKPMNTHSGIFYKIVSVDSLSTFKGELSEKYKGSVTIETNYLYKHDTVGAWISFLEPILLSQDLLLKLGFEIVTDNIIKRKYYRLRLKGFCIDINEWSNTLGRDYGIHIDNLLCDSVLSGDIQYLHQLQNYIYDATGEELDVKELFK